MEKTFVDAHVECVLLLSVRRRMKQCSMCKLHNGLPKPGSKSSWFLEAKLSGILVQNTRRGQKSLRSSKLVFTTAGTGRGRGRVRGKRKRKN